MVQNFDIMELLKSATWALHEQAEHHPFQRATVAGNLSRDEYIAYLGAMFHIHRTLEQCLSQAAALSPAVCTMAREERFREAGIRTDLAHFGIDPDGLDATPAVRHLCEELESILTENPAALLGHFYVLEGSTNGSRFIARAIRAALGLNERTGTAYLDPYGDDQRRQWAAFKDDMRSCTFTAMETAAIIEAAKSMFCALIRVSDDLLPSSNPTRAAAVLP